MSSPDGEDLILEELNKAIAGVEELYDLLESPTEPNSLRAIGVLSRIGSHLDFAKIRREMERQQRAERSK